MSPEKWNEARSSEQTVNIMGGERETGKRNPDKRRGEEGIGEQEGLFEVRIEKIRMRDTIIDEVIIGLRRNLTLVRFP